MFEELNLHDLVGTLIVLTQKGKGEAIAETVFEKRWQELREPFLIETKKLTLVTVGVEVGRWKCVIVATVGKRGGVGEALFFYDTEEEYPAHRLKLAGVNESLNETFIDLDGIREYKTEHRLQRAEVIAYIKDVVLPNLILAIQENPDPHEGHIQDIFMVNSVSTIDVFSGGAWGQGKNS